MATDDQLRHLVARSVEVIAEHQHVGGAYLASPTFPVYRFSWLRDGAFTADAMSRAGERASADRFFGWCARTINARADHIRSLVARVEAGDAVAHDEHPPTRFTVDGADSGEDWWDFQLDGYGTWIWALTEHHRRRPDTVQPTGDVVAAVEECVRYLAAFWQQPCYDWWEEFDSDVHTSTIAAVQAGLRAAGSVDLGCSPEVMSLASATASAIEAFVLDRCVIDGHLVKMLGDRRVDASLIAVFTPFNTFDPNGALAAGTYRKVVADIGPDGVHRYLGDTYFGGGRWVVLAGFLGWHEAETGQRDRARARLEWMHAQATADGLLPEQVTDQVLDRAYIEVWEQKWGPVATPLLWSHAMYITLATSLGLAP